MGRLRWEPGQVSATLPETDRVRSLTIDLPSWAGHRPGQHVDLRLSADDGYQAVRSYSLSSLPQTGKLTVTVERLDDGEVSPYLVDDARPGDFVEVRGPIGGHFVWEPALAGPLLLIAGGSGIAPLASIVRLRVTAGSDVPTRLLYSSRSPQDAIFRDELDALAADDDRLQVIHTFTREAPADWTGYRRRIDRGMLAEVAWPASDHPHAFVCGPTRLVERVASDLVELGYAASSIRTERFGPTGGEDERR